MTERRDILLDLGEAAVRSRGYAGFSYADLARDAGIRKASIHHHFPAKADLALALVERYATRLDAAFDAIEAAPDGPAMMLNRIVDLYRDALGDGSTMCLCAAMATDTALLDPATLEVLDATNRSVVGRLDRIFHDAAEKGLIALTGTTQAEAAAALATLQGAQLLARAAVSTEPFETATLILRKRISG